MAQGLQLMRKNAGVGKLLASAALREHHRILDEAIKLEDWSKAESLFVQASTFLRKSCGLSNLGIVWCRSTGTATVYLYAEACRGLQSTSHR